MIDNTLWEVNHCLGLFKYALGVEIYLYAYSKSHVCVFKYAHLDTMLSIFIDAQMC